MSIFFKFGVESGDPMKVNCDGMDMSLAELKLAIKDLKGIKNVTDFDLQVSLVNNKIRHSSRSSSNLKIDLRVCTFSNITVQLIN